MNEWRIQNSHSNVFQWIILKFKTFKVLQIFPIMYFFLGRFETWNLTRSDVCQKRVENFFLRLKTISRSYWIGNSNNMRSCEKKVITIENLMDLRDCECGIEQGSEKRGEELIFAMRKKWLNFQDFLRKKLR